MQAATGVLGFLFCKNRFFRAGLWTSSRPAPCTGTVVAGCKCAN